jgi:hypothetical protein
MKVEPLKEAASVKEGCGCKKRKPSRDHKAVSPVQLSTQKRYTKERQEREEPVKQKKPATEKKAPSRVKTWLKKVLNFPEEELAAASVDRVATLQVRNPAQLAALRKAGAFSCHGSWR